MPSDLFVDPGFVAPGFVDTGVYYPVGGAPFDLEFPGVTYWRAENASPAYAVENATLGPVVSQ